jgi:hypothetical protein
MHVKSVCNSVKSSTIKLCVFASLNCYKKKKLSFHYFLTIFSSAVDNTTLELLPPEVLSKDAPFATSHFLRGLGSLLGSFAA